MGAFGVEFGVCNVCVFEWVCLGCRRLMRPLQKAICSRCPKNSGCINNIQEPREGEDLRNDVNSLLKLAQKVRGRCVVGGSDSHREASQSCGRGPPQ